MSAFVERFESLVLAWDMVLWTVSGACFGSLRAVRWRIGTLFATKIR